MSSVTNPARGTVAEGFEATALENDRRDLRPNVLALARARPWPLVVWTAMLGWSLALFAIIRNDYATFRLGRFDLGNMVQAVWSTAHGRPLETSEGGTGEQMSRLGSHVDPILALLAPLWALFPSPLTLAAVQIAACALGALPVFWLGRRHLDSERAAALIALAYLAYPWLAWTALDAFHPVTLAIPLFLYAIWFLDTGRTWAFVACALLVLASGELMGLTLAALGLWYWLARKQARAGIAIAFAGVAWTTLALLFIIPHFGQEASPFRDRYASVGGSPGGLLRTAFTDPGAIVSAVTSGADLSYLLWLAVPVVALFALAPALALVAMPQLGINALSDWPATTDPRHHYIAAIVPFLVAGSVLGLARVRRERRVAVALAVATVSASLALLLGPWPLPGTRPAGFHATLAAEHVAALRAAVEVPPEGAAVSATNAAGSHLADRRYLYSVPVVGRAEWIVLDTWNTWMPGAPARKEGLHPELMRAFLERVRTSPEWREVFERDGVLVFEKVSPT